MPSTKHPRQPMAMGGRVKGKANAAQPESGPHRETAPVSAPAAKSPSINSISAACVDTSSPYACLCKTLSAVICPVISIEWEMPLVGPSFAGGRFARMMSEEQLALSLDHRFDGRGEHLQKQRQCDGQVHGVIIHGKMARNRLPQRGACERHLVSGPRLLDILDDRAKALTQHAHLFLDAALDLGTSQSMRDGCSQIGHGKLRV